MGSRNAEVKNCNGPCKSRRWAKKEVKPLDRDTKQKRRAEEGTAPKTPTMITVEKVVGHERSVETSI